MDFQLETTSRPSDRWDIQVDADFRENYVEYTHIWGVVIRAKTIDLALALVPRGRELKERYPNNT